MNIMACTTTVMALMLVCAEGFVLPVHRASPATTSTSWGLHVMTSPDAVSSSSGEFVKSLRPKSSPSLQTAVENLDASTVSTLLASGEEWMDEETTNAAFWAVVRAVDQAEADDKPLSADVSRMIHHILDADMVHLQSREKQTTNVTCLQPKLEGAAAFGSSIGYFMDDQTHQDLPLKEGRKCEGGTCCEACSRNIFPTFASLDETDLDVSFPQLESFSFNNLETVPTATIIQFVRLIERVRRTIAHEYGLDLASILPLQTYSRKYVAGTTQQGGGGGEGDFVILHTDESTHSSYHYSCVLYLNTQGVDFEGGNFVFNDKAKPGDVNPPEYQHDETKEPLTLAEEMKMAKLKGRKLTPFHPSRGAAVIFSSGWENMHEVEKLTSGTRYAVPSFFTTCPVPEAAYTQMAVGKPKTDEDIADDWLHLLLAHRQEEPQEAVGRVKELLMKWHYMCTPLDQHQSSEGVIFSGSQAKGKSHADTAAVSQPTPAVSPSPTAVAEVATVKSDTEAVVSPAATEEPDAAPANPYANWASAVDPASGKTYYYDTVTRETSWTWPPY